MKFSDENKDILFCKRMFSEVSEGGISKFFQGASPKAPNFRHFTYNKLFHHIIVHPLAKICDMQEFLTLNLIPT